MKGVATVLAALSLLQLPIAVEAQQCVSSPAPQPDSSRPTLHGRMVYQSGNQIYLTDFDLGTTNPISFSTSAQPGVSVQFNNPRNANFSADGRWIVFSAASVGGVSRTDVYVAAVDGSHLVNLTADQNGSFPNEDARFTFDGAHVVYKQRYFPNGVTAGAIMEMQIDLPSSSTSDPSRVGDPFTLLDDGHSEFSQPSLSPSGKYLYYTSGVGANEGVYRLNLQTKTTSTISATPGVEAYFPVSRDLTTTLYTGWVSSTNNNDQIFLYAPTLRNSAIRLAFNDLKYNNSDPAVVDETYIIFSSNRCVVNGERSMKLYIGQLGTSNYWPLDIDHINDPVPDILGADYTIIPAN